VLAKSIKKIYPVVIAQDHSLKHGLANHIARRQFEQEKQALHLRDGLVVMPLSLLVIEDLERTIPHLNDFSFLEVLDEYRSKEQTPIHTFINALVRLLRKKGVAQRDNEWVLERLAEIKQEMKVELDMK
jgi:hypothetical protein